MGDPIRGPHGGYAFAERAPVLRDGRVAAVVSAMIPVDRLRRSLAFQDLPEGWKASIVDGNGEVVLSSDTRSLGVGHRAAAAALQARRQGNHGLYRFTRRRGDPAIGAWAPVAGTAWSVHVTVPDAAYFGPLRDALTVMGVAALACLVLFLVLARLFVAELRESRAREAAALQSQRMEALGRLTGGIAHDLNNLLTPVIGGLDLLKRRLGADPRSLRHLELALSGADRAKTLISRLLAFSRRQTLAPQDIDLAVLIAGLMPLVEKSVGPAIGVTVSVPDDLPAVHADPGQLELGILNLVINARDAMPEGGAIRITATFAEAPAMAGLATHRYIAVSVADTGSGMDEGTIRQAVDPFFTTKAADKGTGLGLSMVDGFAGQSGGRLILASEPGRGTTATMVLPVGGSKPAPATRRDPAEDAPPLDILLVDDDIAVRVSIAEVLREAGHSVAEAESVAAALDLLDACVPVDVVVTDYLMPERSGADLIRAIRQTHPGLPVLLVTGYISVAADVPADVPTLSKPFRADDLLKSVAAVAR